jgi:hypothetical protein
VLADLISMQQTNAVRLTRVIEGGLFSDEFVLAFLPTP